MSEDYSETLIHSDFLITTTRKSRFARGKMVKDKSFTVCPRCGCKHAEIEHGLTIACVCGLSLTVRGNALIVRGAI